MRESLTCSHLCEPGGAGVEVDGLKADHLARLCALANGHTHHGVLLLWNHQHFKDLQWAGQREVKVLEGEQTTDMIYPQIHTCTNAHLLQIDSQNKLIVSYTHAHKKDRAHVPGKTA